LLPELKNDIDSQLAMTKQLKKKNRLSKIPREVTITMSLELLALVGLPLLGWLSLPLRYSRYEDTNRSWHRELLLRILKGFDIDKSYASSNLSQLETASIAALSQDD
jgi:hypothetical protein